MLLEVNACFKKIKKKKFFYEINFFFLINNLLRLGSNVKIKNYLSAETNKKFF
jgi:hypothetical protein